MKRKYIIPKTEVIGISQIKFLNTSEIPQGSGLNGKSGDVAESSLRGNALELDGGDSFEFGNY